MRRLFLASIMFVGFMILSASSVKAQTQNICAGSPIPAGWVLVNDFHSPFQCGSPINTSALNMWTIERFDNKTRDARLTVCNPPQSGQAPGFGMPAGWALETTFMDMFRCGRPPAGSNFHNVGIIKCLNCPLPTPTPTPQPGPDYEGFFDHVNCNDMQGWVWNKNAGTTPVRIDILINDTVFTQVMADQFRQDLLNAGKGDGRHAFKFELPPRLKNNRLNGVKIRVTGTNFLVNPSNRTFNCPNPIDNAEFFVKQHYLDFLAREADPGGLNFWKNQITQCGTDPACLEHMRIQVSKAFFLSIEFQQTGYFLTRFYKAAFSRMPTVAEFSADKNILSQGVIVGVPGWENLLSSNKSTYTNTFVTRPAFVTAFGPLLNHEYVDRLFFNAGITDTNFRNSLVNQLNTGQISRATALRQIVDDAGFIQREFNPAFVMMQYLGYLRRHPSDPPDGPTMPGFFFWLNKLNSQGDQNEMVKSFLVAVEYRNRFGIDAPFPGAGEGMAPQALNPPQPIPLCNDSDGDGFCDENDCNPWDPTIYPGAPIFCGWGEDRNCNYMDDDWECYGWMWL